MKPTLKVLLLLSASLLAGNSLAADPGSTSTTPPPGGPNRGMQMGMPMGGGMKMKGGGCMQGNPDRMAMMSQHREQMEQMHGVAVELKQAKTDKKRIELLQRYVGLMDEHQQEMMKMMPCMATPDAKAADTPDTPDAEHEHVH